VTRQKAPWSFAAVDIEVPSSGTREVLLTRASGDWTGWTVDGVTAPASVTDELTVTAPSSLLGRRWRLLDPDGRERIVGCVVAAKAGSASEDLTVDVSTGATIVEVTIAGGGGGGAVASVNGETGVVVLDAGDVGADPAGSAAAVAGDLATHEGLTTTAHGGIVASTDARLTDARTPTAHEASHHHDGSDPLSAVDVGADPAGTAAALVAALPSFSAGRGIDITEVTPGVMEVGFDNIQVDVYTPGTTSLTVPSWARMAYVTCIGGGGGGGGGRRGATSTVRGGGGGGQGGAVVSGWVRAANIATTISVGAGGTSGAGGASDSTSGANGGNGGDTAVYYGTGLALLRAAGGEGGRGGTNTDGGQGGGLSPWALNYYWPPAAGNGMPGSDGGGATAVLTMLSGRFAAQTADPSATTAWITLDTMWRILSAGVGGGGGGGGYTAANANSDPSTGVAGLVHPHSHAYGAAGTSGSKDGLAGTAVTPTTTDLLLVGAGGGGGYQSSSGAAGNGGAGIGYGGPGGGGGAALNGNTAGAGGAGAGGVLRIIWVA